jgi:putative ABC transport system substrate-binding protein
MRPRDFITLLGGAAAWPVVARGQQADRMRRVGVLMGGVTEGDAVAKAQLTAFAQGLRALGWTEGRNLRIDYRWPVGDIKRMQTDARRRNSVLSSSGPRGIF